MSKKAVVLSIVLSLISALLAAALVIFGGQYIGQKNANGAGSTSEAYEQSHTPDPEVHFVNVSNIVITLSNSNGRSKNYLLLDLVFLTNKDGDVARIEGSIPLIKSATVDYLTNMNYQDISTVTVPDLRNSLLAEYRKAYAVLKINMPFSDVMISKMVFQ